MPRIGLWELLFILLIVVLLFGATRIPQLGRGLGEGIRNFRRGLKGSAADGAAEDKESSTQDPR